MSDEEDIRPLGAWRPELLALLQEAAGLPTTRRGWTFESFPGDTAAAAAVRRFVSRAKPGDPATLLLLGSPGTGKTGLATAALTSQLPASYEAHPWAWAAVAGQTFKRRKVAKMWFEEWDELVRRFEEAKQKWIPEAHLLAELMRCDLLVLDAIDTRPLTDWRMSLMLSLLRRLEFGGTTILTMNCGIPEAVHILGERVVDRITGVGVDLIELGGRSLRRK